MSSIAPLSVVVEVYRRWQISAVEWAEREDLEKRNRELEGINAALVKEVLDLRDQLGTPARVFVFLDADGYPFLNKFVCRGRDGGSAAAKILLDSIHEYIKAHIEVKKYQISVNAFLNQWGLYSCYRKRVDHDTFRKFYQGLNQASPSCSFVDVGFGSQIADNKVKDLLAREIERGQTLKVFIGGSHDNGYATVLQKHITDGYKHKLVLLPGYKEIAKEVEALGLATHVVKNLFYPERLPSTPASAINRPSYSWSPAIISRGKKAIFDKRARIRYTPSEQGSEYTPFDESDSSGRSFQDVSDSEGEPSTMATVDPQRTPRNRRSPALGSIDIDASRANRLDEDLSTVLSPTNTSSVADSVDTDLPDDLYDCETVRPLVRPRAKAILPSTSSAGPELTSNRRPQPSGLTHPSPPPYTSSAWDTPLTRKSTATNLRVGLRGGPTAVSPPPQIPQAQTPAAEDEWETVPSRARKGGPSNQHAQQLPRPDLPLSEQTLMPPPCIPHYLKSSCQYKNCKGHKYTLTNAHLKELRQEARKTPCPSVAQGMSCTLSDCPWQHK